jgi:hypothetical protein
MAKYLYVYHGSGSMPQNQEEIDKVMQAWGSWFGQLGAAVVDGGNPVGKSTTVNNGSVVGNGGANPGERLFDHRGIEPGGCGGEGEGVPAACCRRQRGDCRDPADVRDSTVRHRSRSRLRTEFIDRRG